jgi:hypothetical protein
MVNPNQWNMDMGIGGVASPQLMYRSAYSPSVYASMAPKTPYQWTPEAYADGSSIEPVSFTPIPNGESSGSIYGPSYMATQKPMVGSGGTFYLDHGPSTSYASSYTYHPGLDMGSRPPPTTDMSPFGMNALQSSLPGAMIDRQLPAPTATRSSISGASVRSDGLPTPVRTLSNSQSSPSSSNLNYPRWPMDTTSSEPRADGVSPLASNEMMAPPLPKPGVSTTTTLPDSSSLCYIAFSSGAEPSVANSTATSSYSTTHTPALSNIRSYLTSPGPQSAAPSDASTVSRTNSTSSSMYVFSNDTSTKRESASDISTSAGTGVLSNPNEGTLVSGQRYAPICPSLMEPSQTSLEKRNSTARQRTSISNLSNRGY